MPCFACCLACWSTFIRGYFCIIQLYLCRPLVAIITCGIQYFTCATSHNQIVLVSRQSSRRLIFEDVEQMRSGREFNLSLRSHGGASIVLIPPRMIGREIGTGLLTIGEYRYVHLGVAADPNVTPIKAKYDGKYVIFKLPDGQEVGLNISLGKMRERMHINAVKHHSKGPREDVTAYRWTVNNDGSLSPMDAQHLAIGDLKSSGLDPEINVGATVLEMTDVDEGGDGAKSVPVARQVM